ncbi:hypothetical protein FisN_12Hu131 [Fistulifera solaris]|uniref:Uncharacterized protein n=1 Tax=Fistulifera solaris TaxID=1519565 RepID=A0A1Z5KCC7_FISSO|nr:hypothetical protein FisN_12Hu131 [Fistulifera solaris]|eukprot:GAX23568.1 hypothetical protein FisN_12Hu131 [Fistulifera solaris]
MESKDPPKAKKRATLIQISASQAEEGNHKAPSVSRKDDQCKSSTKSTRNPAIYSDTEDDYQDHHKPALTSAAQKVAHLESRSLLPGESLRHLPLTTARKRKKPRQVGVPTEAMAVVHILHDEVRDYLASQSLDREERVMLIQWYKAVRDQLTEQNELLVENCRLTTNRRDLDKQVIKQRQELITLQSNIRSVENEIKDLENRVVVNQQQSRAQRDATRFLEGLGQLAATSRSLHP